jgi:hypothetical protein
MRSKLATITAVIIGGAVAMSVSRASAQVFLGPTPYLSQSDSPFIAGIQNGTIYLETFESGALTVPGVSISDGMVMGPSTLTDSVDADDGVIDGLGRAGHSWFFGDGSTGIRFTFNPAVLGGLPTEAGIVWTDGAPTSTTLFQAFGPNGALLGSVGPVAIADGNNIGATAEDRLFGVINPGGISSIQISDSFGGMEVDHLQYGLPVQVQAQAVPALGGGRFFAVAAMFVLVGALSLSRKVRRSAAIAHLEG